MSRSKIWRTLLSSISIWIFAFGPIASAQDAEPAPETVPDPESETAPETIMSAMRLLEIILAIDEEAELTGNGATFAIDDTIVTLVFDANADRMRLFSQIRPSDGLSGAQLRRLMQANFDTALDVRYAIANGILWSTFIHPLESLDDEAFLIALGQTVNAVITYGSSYSSGLLSYRGGDSQEILRHNLIERLKKKGQEI